MINKNVSNLAIVELDHSSGDFQYWNLLTNKSADCQAEGFTCALHLQTTWIANICQSGDNNNETCKNSLYKV